MLSILNFQITISLYPGSGTVFSQFIYIFLAVCWDRGELFFAISHFTTVRKHWKGALKLRDREFMLNWEKKWYWYREENNQVILLSWKYNVIYKLLNPFTPKSDLIDFTLSNARRFYSSKGDLLGVKGLIQYSQFNTSNHIKVYESFVSFSYGT